MARGNRRLPRGAQPAKRKLASGGYAEGYVDANGLFTAFEAITEAYAGSATVDHSISYDTSSSSSGSSGSYDSGSSGSSSSSSSYSSYDSGSSSSSDSGSSGSY